MWNSSRPTELDAMNGFSACAPSFKRCLSDSGSAARFSFDEEGEGVTPPGGDGE